MRSDRSEGRGRRRLRPDVYRTNGRCRRCSTGLGLQSPRDALFIRTDLAGELLDRCLTLRSLGRHAGRPIIELTLSLSDLAFEGRNRVAAGDCTYHNGLIQAPISLRPATHAPRDILLISIVCFSGGAVTGSKLRARPRRYACGSGSSRVPKSPRDILGPRLQEHAGCRTQPQPARSAGEPLNRAAMSSTMGSDKPERRAPCDTARHGPARTERDSAIELELSADELLFLAPRGALNRPALCSVSTTDDARAIRASFGAARRRPWRIGAVAVALGVMVAAALVAGVPKRESAIPTAGARAVMRTQAEKPATPDTFAASASRPLPVRFANPFDAVEVFEFPPGTSREHAREAVAQFLIDRARSRHARPVQRARTRRGTQGS